MNYGPTKEKIPLSIMLSSSGHIVRREAMWPVSQEGTRSLRTDKVVSNIIMVFNLGVHLAGSSLKAHGPVLKSYLGAIWG